MVLSDTLKRVDAQIDKVIQLVNSNGGAMLAFMTDDKTVWDSLKPMLSPDEVAEFLDISLSTVKRMLYDGKLKGQKFGRQWRISRDDLKAFYEGKNK